MKTSEMIKISAIIKLQRLTKIDGYVEKTDKGYVLHPATFKKL